MLFRSQNFDKNSGSQVIKFDNFDCLQLYVSTMHVTVLWCPDSLFQREQQSKRDDPVHALITAPEGSAVDIMSVVARYLSLMSSTSLGLEGCSW